MDFEELYDKYIDEPKRRRQRVNIGFRLLYNDTNDNDNSKLIWTGVSILSLIIFLWVFNITNSDFLFQIIPVGITFCSIYQYRPRYCEKCAQKMVRQVHSDSMYYFCDFCKLKIKTAFGVAGPG
ncbi:MAG: hypothetical protein ACK5QC_03470 [Bacteroidota bacterium]